MISQMTGAFATASVIMPVRATPPELLRAAIESILFQSVRDIELIIVEDPSEHPGLKVVSEFKDDRLRYIYNEELTGLVAQRNLGLQTATGEYIVKADSDDISEPHRIERQCAYLSERPEIGVVGSWLTIIDENGRETGLRRYPTDSCEIHTAMRRINPIAQPAACFRRSLFEEHGGYPEGYPVCQDYAYWSHLANRGVRFANLPEPLVRYRQHAASIKSTKLRESVRATIRVKQQYWHNELTPGDRLRLIGEQALEHLPSKFVHWLFRTLYQ
ncbi:MAG: glycosyltransferase [Planctomycetota bacterium]